MKSAPRSRARLAAALSALLCAISPAAGLADTCSTSVFTRAQSFPAGGSPAVVVLGDFNGDGKLDAVAAGDAYPAQIAVLLGDGNGSFGAPIFTSATPYGVMVLAAGYFDGDDNLDLVVGDVFYLTILLGNGDGTFTSSQTNLSSAVSPSGIAIGDFDGDGKLDVAESSQNNGPVVFFGHGDGTFEPYLSVDQSMPATSLGVAVLDASGRSSLVVSRAYSSIVAVYAGQAGRTFSPALQLNVEDPVGPLALGDFNGDGKVDIAVTANSSAAVLLGNGDGTFQAAIESPLGPQPVELAAADVNLDGNLDLVASRGDRAGNVFLLLGNGAGQLSLDTGYQTGPSSASTAVGDLNGDGSPDIVSADASSTTISVLMSDGGGRFRGVESLPTLNFPGNVAEADFNGDGLPDLAAVGFLPDGSNNGAVQILLGDGLGGFPPYSQKLAGYGAIWVAAGDFNEDGKQDVAVLSQYNNSLNVLLGNGDGSLQDPISSTLSYNGRQAAAADLDGDGHLDLVVIEGVFYSPGAIAVLHGNGDGTFQPPVEQTRQALPTGLLVADLNGDGWLDVAIGNQTLSGPDTISVFFGDGTGALLPPVDFASGPDPGGLVSGDFTGDGKLDLLVADTGASNVSLLAGDGNGGFAAPRLIAIGWPPLDVVAGDFNGDGKLDFATSNGAAGNLSLLLGLGTGAFQSPVAYLTGDNDTFLLAADLLGSGTLDLAVANTGGSTVSILLNSRLAASVGSPSALVGSAAVLKASASGFGALSYQWRRNGIALSDGGSVSGATTATLTIDPVAFTDAGSYDVLVTDSCTSVASDPAQLSVEFADVPVSSIFHPDIITIATAGITAGCGGADYCPSALVSRAQMAVFLLKSEHGSAYVPPACTGLFADVPCPSTYANWIEQLFNEGVTAGCGGADYCPDASITRAQMAVFLLKTSQGSGYVPPAATAIFDDVPVGAFADAFIDDLYTRGIAGGCSATPLLYCPNNVVNRAQMAAFLVNTFF